MLKFLIKVFISLYLLNMLMDQVDTLHPGVRVRVAQMLKFLIKVFISLYLLNMLMDQVDTLHGGRYWSEVLCCTIMTRLDDLEVKVTDLEILC